MMAAMPAIAQIPAQHPEISIIAVLWSSTEYSVTSVKATNSTVLMKRTILMSTSFATDVFLTEARAKYAITAIIPIAISSGISLNMRTIIRAMFKLYLFAMVNRYHN